MKYLISLGVFAIALLTACSSGSTNNSAKMVRKVSSQEVIGQYQSEIQSGFVNILNIRQLGLEKFYITVQPKAGQQGCSFSGESELTGNEIHIALSNIDKQLSGVMTIAFDGASATVGTLTPDTRYDLQSFCRSGGTLYGQYVKMK